MGTNFYVFRTEKFPSLQTLTLRHGRDGTQWTLPLEKDGRVVSSKEIRSVWYRRPGIPVSTELADKRQERFVINEARAALWSFYTTTTGVRWVNPPLIGTRLLEDNQFFQLQVASSVGLRTPSTIISNNPRDVLDFVHVHRNGVVLKSIFRTALIVNGKVQLLYTNRLQEADVIKRADQIALCPVMIQEYVPKHLELRITVVGNQVFACAIHSQDSERTRDDWRRYDFSKVKHEQFVLPEEIHLKLLELMRRLGIVYGGVDVILTPDGEYVFLEVNPSGQWLWLEELTELPISQAIAELLTQG